MFSLLDQVVLRQLPVREPERLVQLDWNGRMLATTYGFGELLSYPLCRDLQEQTQVFDGVVLPPSGAGQLLDRGSSTSRSRVEIVSGSYFSGARRAAARRDA